MTDGKSFVTVLARVEVTLLAGESETPLTEDQVRDFVSRMDEAVVKFKTEHKLLAPKTRHDIVRMV